MKKNKIIFICDEQEITLGQIRKNSVYAYVSQAGDFYNTDFFVEKTNVEDFQKEALKNFKKFFNRKMKKQLTKK